MKSILLHIDSDGCMQARLQVALDMARACNGHITCLQAVSYEVFGAGRLLWLGDGGGDAQDQRGGRGLAGKARSRTRQ